ncbi:hypothetical protein [Microbacterium sp. 5K110]|jgi:hypothetical protein|uniref:phage tail tube protein n=1 Tax=Microbacterium sp. 5K110 TaxID=2578104 RepID=UPI0010FECE0A|nr:hypothetical protein [Microbacterium sp. 5K110]TLF33231.1 hypothetical protein FE256_03810 [Microbacterium sp. 5K110]
MADAPEAFGGPPAVDQTGNLTIWAIPAATAGVNLDAITAANLAATSAKRITYSFMQGGWNPNPSQGKNADTRLTSPQSRQSLQAVTQEVPDLSYVDSTDAGSASVILTPGDWIFVERRNVPQKTLAAASQKVRAYSLTLGAQLPGPIQDGKFTMKQAAAVNYISAEHALT